MNRARPVPGAQGSTSLVSLPWSSSAACFFRRTQAAFSFCFAEFTVSFPPLYLHFASSTVLALGAWAGEGLDGKVKDTERRLIQVDGEKIRHILSELFRTARGTLKRAAGSEGSLG